MANTVEMRADFEFMSSLKLLSCKGCKKQFDDNDEVEWGLEMDIINITCNKCTYVSQFTKEELRKAK